MYLEKQKEKLKLVRKKKQKKSYEDLKPEERFKVYDSDEKKYLDIEFDGESVNSKFPIAKQLIENLRSDKPFYIKSVEAVYIADKLSSRLKLDDNGTMTIEKKDAIRVAEIIQLDPQDLIRYILAMEKKLDPENPETKIKLADFLYLARNARNFNLLAYGSEPEKKETKVLVKMKTAIYNSWNKNINVKIEDHEKNQVENISENASHEPEIIFENKNISTSSKKEHSTIDPVTGEVKDPSIIKVEKLDNDHIRIYTNNEIIIEKDDFEIYSYRDLVEEREAEAEKNRKLGIKNNYVDFEKEKSLLDVNPENIPDAVAEKFVSGTQADLPPNELALYESQFGQLFDEEKEEFEKTKSISSLLSRSKKYFCKDFRNTAPFSDELVMKNKFLTPKNIYNILFQLFDKEFSEVRIATQKTLLRDICFAKREFLNGEVKEYLLVSVHYFLATIYGMILQKNKESFYQNVYDDFEKINEKYITAIIDDLHILLGVKLFEKVHDSYFVNVIFSADSVTTKTRVLTFDLNALKLVFQEKAAEADSEFIEKLYEEKWKGLKKSIADSIKILHYGDKNVANALKRKVQFLELGSEYFFRKKQGEN